MEIHADVTSSHDIDDERVQVQLREIVPAVTDGEGNIVEHEQHRNAMHIDLDRATAAEWIEAGSVQVTFTVAQRATARAARTSK